MIADLWQDLRYGLRLLKKQPGFAAVAALTLALGIGANTAVFSVVNAVLLQPLPFKHPEQLARVTADLEKPKLSDVGLSPAELFDIRDRSGVFEQICGVFPINSNMTGGDQPERVEALLVDVNYFALLGVGAQLGRVFQPEDYQPGIAQVAVISDGLWKRRYGADPAALGKKLWLDNDVYQIVGVMPAGFRHPGRVIQTEVDVWNPAGWVGPPFNNPPRTTRFLAGAIARLKPGVSSAEAQLRLIKLAGELSREYPQDYPAHSGWTPRVVGLQADLVGNVKPVLQMLLAAVGLVLLIACVNVANLLLLRAAAREREIAVRVTLGASRARLLRQMLAESVLLFLLGGALGLLVAICGVRALVKLSPGDLTRLGAVGVDASVLSFTLAVSLLTGVIFGLIPAMQAASPDLQESLKEAARGLSGGARGARARSLLVVLEFALALMLLVSAALALRSFQRLRNADPGFKAENVLTANLWLPQPNVPETGPYFNHAARATLYQQVIARIRALPGVVSVGGVSPLPLSGRRSNTTFIIEGRPLDAASANTAQTFLASPDYFETMSIALLKGRLFTERDDARAPGVVVVSQTFAEKFFQNEDPLGKRVKFRGRFRSSADWETIIGVVRDVKMDGLHLESKPQVYRSALQASDLAFTLVARAADAAALAEAARAQVRAVDPNLPVYSVRTMDEVVAHTVSQQRYALALLGVFACVALALAAVGIYGVMSYATSQRAHEIGIRLALGATARDVLKLMLRQGMTLALAGIVAGVAGAVLATRFLKFMLFGVGPTDLVSFVGVIAVLGAVALAACYIPARRATKVDPLISLRCE